MRCKLIAATFLLLVVAFGRSVYSIDLGNSSTKRPVSVVDAISMTRIELDWQRGSVGQFSPKGSRFAVVLKKGNLEKNCNEYSLVVFEATDLFKSHPQTIITMESTSNDDALSDLKWLSDGATIAFLGSRQGEPKQVYLVNCLTKKLQKLTNSRTKVETYDVTSRGETVVYSAKALADQEKLSRIRMEGLAIAPEQSAMSLAEGQWIPVSKQLFVKQRGSDAKLLYDTARNPWASGIRSGVPFEITSIAISPAEEFAIIGTSIPPKFPGDWHSYTDGWLKTMIGHGAMLPAFGLVDLKSGNVEPFLNAPGRSADGEVFWTSDSSVVLTSFLPLDSANPAENEARRNGPPKVVEVDVKTRNINTVTDEWRPIKWNAQTSTLMMSKDAKLFANFRRESRTWVKQSSDSADVEIFRPAYYPKSTNGRYVIGTRETPTVAPELVAYDLQTRTSAVLTDLNPQFRKIGFGEVKKITWKNKYDDECDGYLIKPVGYQVNRRYPAVLMMKGFNDAFIIDGQGYSTSFAPQPLAGQGFVVLMISYPRSIQRQAGTIQEVTNYMASVEAAVDYLDTEELIDRDRVGIIGFSRTSWLVEFILTKSTYSFAAATSASSGIYNYISYMLVNRSTYQNNSDNLLGAPFGETFDRFRKNASGFNVDKIRTPLLIEANGISDVLSMFEVYAGLRRLGKPVEMIYYPDAPHQMVKPSERRASLQRNVDWYRFWLKGEEDPAPEKREQYARWRALRNRNDVNQKGS